MPRYAANLSLMFGEHALVDRFAAAADAGFSLVEIQFPYDHPAGTLAARARAAGVEVVLINAPPGDFAAGERGLAGLPDDAGRFVPSIDLAARYANELGAEMVHVMSGIGGPEGPGVFPYLAERLRDASDMLAVKGLTTVIEPLNPFDVPGYLLTDFEQAADLIASADRPHLRLMFDVYHRQRMAGEILDTLSRLIPIVGHVQIAGVPGRHEPVDCEIDYAWLLPQLDAIGYEGVVGCEYVPRGRTEDGLGWMRRETENAARLHR